MQGSNNNLISWDLANCFSDVIGRDGLEKKEWLDRLNQAERQILPRMEQERNSALAFREILYEETILEQVKAMAHRKGRDWDNFLILGIGGSALGITAMNTALGDPYPQLSGRKPRLIVCDSPDPERMLDLLQVLDLKKTLVNVISKSGGTVETMTQFLIILDALKQQLGDDMIRHLVITTDPEKGALREIAKERSFDTLDFPPEVQGRYSVLTPMGLFAAEIMGWDASGLIEGAKEADRMATQPAPDNLALQLAQLHYSAAVDKQKRLAVMLPYSQALRDFADWWRQLWAESLGKQETVSGRTVFAGQTPLMAQGPIDQHSQLQLWLEGPNDKIITFIEVGSFRNNLKIPSVSPDGSLAYLAGHSLSELISIEAEATRRSLTAHQRPNLTLKVDSVSSRTIGFLFMLYEIATVAAGYLWDVNPLNQPAVEESKIFMYQALKRPGY